MRVGDGLPGVALVAARTHGLIEDFDHLLG
jgi:hypothetical protein